MKKVFVTIVAALAAMALPSMAAGKVEARSTPTICEGKSSAEHYVKTLSDYELARSMLNIMSDARLLSLKSAHDVGVWLQDQPDCSHWGDNMYLLEVKWLYNEAIGRGLTMTMNKIGQGLLRWNPTTNRLEERQGERWIAWTTYLK